MPVGVQVYWRESARIGRTSHATLVNAIVTRLAQACFSGLGLEAPIQEHFSPQTHGSLISRPVFPANSNEPQPSPGLRLLIQAVSLMLFGLLLVPPRLSAKLRKISISFGGGGRHAREDG